ncbi:hypothetical protein [Aquimarina sp. RZ0]|uniref:hypothetical protein n=1 Tax=Aquimarina sp. RZ0 TaxID=2607730 RepID=UPI0011F3B77A|nr:hypothetical protein [Aquimarina sp. RZ0]KAA1244447.1 hypothetical protein F0000_16510 [Aquimarina sp. RZ0]
MKKMKRFLLVILLCIITWSCSSVKLIDSWESKDFQAVKSKKILIAAKSPDVEVRKSYEVSIANQLRNQGINAIEIHKTFPDFEEKEDPTEEEIAEITKQFKNDGITAILVTSLKNTINTRNDNTPKRVDIPAEYQKRYFFSFNAGDDIHMLPKLSALEGGDVPKVELTSTTYVLEAITYDLSQKKDKQLVNVCLVDVTDPNSGKKILNKFSKIVSDQFKKK